GQVWPAYIQLRPIHDIIPSRPLRPPFSFLPLFYLERNPPMQWPGPENRITALAVTNFRNEHRRFGIKRVDRRAHMYIIGKTGTGKSTLIANLARQDLVN